MKTQIMFIHGGTAFSSYDSFITYLKTKDIHDPYNVESAKRWKQTIYEHFGNTCDVFFPAMPNRENARYTEWKLWFERYFQYLTGEVILIGHSLGGYFLAKYLSENTVPFPIKALYLVAAPFRPEHFEGEDGGDFEFDPKKISNLEKMAKNIVVMHSTNDSVVPFSHGEQYHTALPSAQFIAFKDRGHFLDPEFPEIIEDLRKRV